MARKRVLGTAFWVPGGQFCGSNVNFCRLQQISRRIIFRFEISWHSMVTLDTLLLSAAVPVAKGAAAAAAETLSAASSGFASVFRGAANESSPQSGLSKPDAQSLIAEFRSWLQANGIAGELNLDVNVQAGKQLGFTGENAEEIANLVANSPEWQKQLRQLAQQITSVLGGSGGTRFSLSDSGWAIGFE